MADLSAILVLLQQKVLPPSDVGTNFQMLLRWVHFLAGITWIGLLYFFNLVNVPFMKALDAPTKGKVVPTLLPKALWWFRWGAVVTVLAGFIYWFLILRTEPFDNPGVYHGRVIGLWLVVVVIAWFVNYFLLRMPAVTKSGWTVAVIVAALAVVILLAVLRIIAYDNASNRAIAIGVGGGYGVFMMLNVWGIIWPAQKRIIAWTKENAEKGTPIPAESATLARRAFLASRANAWLSLPMLFFMAAASHYPMFSA
ncbi:MAG: urate hydroxylase PuuD [Acidobacteria bacterium]|nr:urate hydroxylase PuuD [Acidobacteriota bacterium]